MTRAERALLTLAAALTAAAGAAHFAQGFSRIAAFVVAAVALAALAWSVSFATEQVGVRFGPSVTGVLQATIGNLPEFFVVIFALEAGERTVAQTAIVGSMVVNALLVLGMVLIAGSLVSPNGRMRFSARLPNDTATLFLAAAITIAVISVVGDTHAAGHGAVDTISVVAAAALLCVYAIWMRQYLRGGGAGDDEAAEPARLSTASGLILLIVAGLASAFVSDWFIDALEPTIHSAHLSQTFAGIVIVAIAGNAVEHAVGIYLAHRGRNDLAISVVKNSVAQIAAFLFPLVVIVSLATATHLSLALPGVWAAALLGTALLIWQITGDGEASPFEGSALIAIYVVLATIAAFEH